MKLDPTDDGYTIDAADLAHLFDRAPSEIQRMMRDGAITTRFERGEGEDEGRCRVTFYDGKRRVRLIVDSGGRVLRRTRTPLARSASPLCEKTGEK